MKSLLSIVAVLAGLLLAAADVKHIDLAGGIKKFIPYGGGEVRLDGKNLQVKHGFSRTLTFPSTGQYRVTAEVISAVPLQFALFSKSGNGYGKEIRVKAEGKYKVDIQFFAYAYGATVCLFSPAGKNAEFTVTDLQVEKIGFPEPKDITVTPKVFAAADYPGINGRTVPGKDGESFRRGQRWYLPVSGIPVPFTSKALTVWVKVRKAPGGKLKLTWKNLSQTLASVPIPEGDFNWVKMRMQNPLAAQPYIILGLDGSANIDGDIAQVILTTDEKFLPAGKIKVSSPLSLVAAFPAFDAIVPDGDLNEKSWNNAFGVSMFRLPDGRAAKEQTMVKFLYDEKNLYLGATAFESALNKWEQRLHEFRNRLKKPDVANCYNDDLVVLMIKREKENKVYEFCINASGVVTDSVCTPPDLWGTRTKFDSGAVAGGKIDHGKFFVEAAIPFAAVGGTPQPGERFKVMIVRYEQSRSEKSTFSAFGFHNLTKFGELSFSSVPVSGEMTGSLQFNSGNNQLGVKSSAPLLVRSVVTANGKNSSFLDREGKFQIKAQGEFSYFASIRDGYTLEEVVRTPLYSGSANVRTMQIKSAAGKKVLVNDQLQKDQYMLLPGSNQIVTDDPDAAFKIGSFEFKTDGSWKKLSSGMLTKNLLCDTSQLWPDWSAGAGLFMAAGRVQQILFYPFVPKGVKDADYSISFDLPEGFVFEGACGYYKLHPLTVGKAEKVVIEGNNYNRYRIDFRKKISHVSKPASHFYVAAFIRPPESAAGKNFKMYFHCASSSGNFVELPNVVNVSVLKSVPGKKMAKQHMQMWTAWLEAMDDDNLRELIAKEFAFAGVTEMMAKNSAGVKQFQLFTFADWNFNLKEFVKKYPETRLVPFSGKDYADGTVMCPRQIAGNVEFAKWFDQEFPKWHKRRGSPDIINLDYEEGIFGSYAACVCKDCLKSFASSAGLKDIPLPAEIRAKYSREWREFMTSQVAGMVHFIYNAVKRHLPHVPFNVYSGYQSEETKINYSIDWNKIYDALDYAGAGYGRPLKAMEDTLKALRGKPAIFGLILNPWRPGSRDVPDIVTEARLMQTMLDADGGTLLFLHGTMDGRSMNAIGAITAFVAENEEFFNPGWKSLNNAVKIKGCPAEVRVNGKGGIMVIAYNLSKSDVECVIEFTQAVDFGTGSSTLKIKVPALKFAARRGKIK